MQEDRFSAVFHRPQGQVPRAAILAYAIAVLTVAYDIGQWLWEQGDPSREGFGSHALHAIYTGGTWVAIGTALALLAQLADRTQR